MATVAWEYEIKAFDNAKRLVSRTQLRRSTKASVPNIGKAYLQAHYTQTIDKDRYYECFDKLGRFIGQIYVIKIDQPTTFEVLSALDAVTTGEV